VKRMEILEEVYGPTEWSESALINLLRVMELTREDERIRQMANMESRHAGQQHRASVFDPTRSHSRPPQSLAGGRQLDPSRVW